MINKTNITVVVTSLVMFVALAGTAKAQTVTFGASGDFANGSNFQATVNQVAAHNPNFVLALGDLSYSSGSEDEWCAKWKASYNNILVLTGNHDSGESSGGDISRYVQYCPFTLTGLTGTYGHNYYFDYPSTNPLVRVIMVRPGVRGSGIISYDLGGSGYNFTANAIDDARAKGIKWIVVGMHKNYISAMEKPNELGSAFIPMLINKRVDLILQGHEHGYERSKQLAQNPSTCPTLTTGSYNANCVVDSDNSFRKGLGSIIHVIGTGGQGLRGLNTGDAEYPYFAAANNTTYGFGKFTVTSTQMSFEFIRSAGGSFTDSFTITDDGTVPPPTNGPTPTPIPGYPDLVVTDISWSPASPAVGSPVTFSATIKNQGDVATPSGVIHGVRFSIDGFLGPWSDNHLSSLAPGASVTVTANGGPSGATWTATSGSHTVVAEVDDVNRMQESVEGNNIREESFTVGTTATTNPTSTPTSCSTSIPSNAASSVSSISVEAGTYKVWSRILGQGSSANSYWLQVDNMCPINVGDLSTSTSWEWIDYQGGNSGNKVLLDLAAGNHTVKIAAREQNVGVDKLIFTKDYTCIPSGTGDNCGGTTVTPTPLPSSSPGTVTTVTIPVSADAHVSSLASSTNYGSAVELFVDGTGTAPQDITYLKFDLSAYAGRIIRSAKLRVTTSSSTNASSGDSQSVKLVTNDAWTESGLTYANRPSSSTLLGTADGGATGAVVEMPLEVTPLATEVGQMLSLSIEQLGQNAWMLNSKEAAFGKAELVLELETAGASPTPSATPKPGDSNGDNVIDGKDYVVWLNNYNTNTTGGVTKGDFNRDGVVDGKDYVTWLNNYGK